jgi:hypothetical protein
MGFVIVSAVGALVGTLDGSAAFGADRGSGDLPNMIRAIRCTMASSSSGWGVGSVLDCRCELTCGLDAPIRGCDRRHLDRAVLELPRLRQVHQSCLCQHLDDSVVHKRQREMMCFHCVVVPCVASNWPAIY